MAFFPIRAPIGAMLAGCLALAALPLTYKTWRQFQSPLESFYLGSYFKANVLPNKALLTGRPLLHRFYIVTVNGHDATPETLPHDLRGVSGRYVAVQPLAFARWLKTAIYQDLSLSEFLAPPVITWAAAAVLLCAAGSVIDVRRRQQLREGQQLRGPETLTRKQFNRTIKQQETGFALRTR